MAKTKKAKKLELWAVWPHGYDEVYIYSSKPKMSTEDCYECGQPRKDVPTGSELTSLCDSIVKYIPGLVEGGAPVQFKVVAV